MRHYRATNLTTGAIVEYDAVLPLPEHMFPPWKIEDVSDAEPSPDEPPPVYSGSWKITRLAFRQRFTPAERVAVEIAALDRADATDEQRAQSAAIRSYQDDVALAEFIDLSDADTQTGVNDLEGVGLLAPGRAVTILTTWPTAEEVSNGD